MACCLADKQTCCLCDLALFCASQGWGNVVNTAILCLLMAAFGQTGNKYNHYALDAVWRISFGVGLVPVTGMLVYRLFFLQESKVWKKQNKPTQVSASHQVKGTAAAAVSLPVCSSPFI